MSDEYITTVSRAKANIGRRVYWDDTSNRYCFLRQGIIEEVSGHNILINNDWLSRGSLRHLRNFEDGGDWGKLK